jgi:hypothetical protein
MRWARIAAAAALTAGPASGEVSDADVEALVSVLGMATEVSVARELTPGERETLEAETRATLEENPEDLIAMVPVLAEMALALGTGTYAATRGVMRDTLRQGFADAFPETDALPERLLAEVDPLWGAHGEGVGLSRLDTMASLWLTKLDAEPELGPEGVTLEMDESEAHGEAKAITYETQPIANQQMMSKMNAWAEGVYEAWPRLTAAERRSATGTALRPEVPGRDVILKVTGVESLPLWLAGLTLAFTEEERAAWPNLMTWLEQGGAAAPMAELLGRLSGQGAGRSPAEMMSSMNALSMTRNLNNYMMNNGNSAAGWDGGAAMMGLQ